MLSNDPPEGITAGPVSEDDMFIWEALIQGPEGTPFEGGVFPAELRFPKDYPLAPPKMKFVTEMWHPNGMFDHLGHASLCSLTYVRKKHELVRIRANVKNSIPQRRSLYIDPSRARRRPHALRTSLRAVVTHTKRREDLGQRHEHVGRAER